MITQHIYNETHIRVNSPFGGDDIYVPNINNMMYKNYCFLEEKM